MQYENIEINKKNKKKIISYFLIDVRETKEHDKEHIVNSINLPQSQFSNVKLMKLIKNNNNIILYCQSGRRSLEVCKMLNKFDNTKFYNLIGGIISWKEHGLTTVKNHKITSNIQKKL